MSPRLLRQSRAYDRLAKKHGLATSEQLRASPARYCWDLIERDVKSLLARRRHLPIRSRGSYPEVLVNYAAIMFLTCCLVEKRPPPPELVHLIWQQLDVESFGVKKGEKDSEIFKAQEIRSDNPLMSNRELARLVKVPTATIGRWVKSGLLPPPEGVAR